MFWDVLLGFQDPPEGELLDLDALPAWRSLEFIPSVAGHVVADALGDGDPRELPSARHALVAQHGTDALDRWREWSPLTSRTYRPHRADSTFLFFTRERVWARPLLGTANLLYGTGHALAGLLWAPVDRGERLARGAKGVAMSVPELFFFSVRQGSYPIAPPEAPKRVLSALH